MIADKSSFRLGPRLHFGLQVTILLLQGNVDLEKHHEPTVPVLFLVLIFHGRMVIFQS